MSSTKINGKEIPILSGDVITISFAPGSPYPGDEGTWSYWTAVNPIQPVTARWRGDDPGERFRRMEGDPVHAVPWALACMSTSLRPATQMEVEAWLNGHPKESPFAGNFRIGSITGQVVRTAAGYQLKQDTLE